MGYIHGLHLWASLYSWATFMWFGFASNDLVATKLQNPWCTNIPKTRCDSDRQHQNLNILLVKDLLIARTKLKKINSNLKCRKILWCRLTCTIQLFPRLCIECKRKVTLENENLHAFCEFESYGRTEQLLVARRKNKFWPLLSVIWTYKRTVGIF